MLSPTIAESGYGDSERVLTKDELYRQMKWEELEEERVRKYLLANLYQLLQLGADGN